MMDYSHLVDDFLQSGGTVTALPEGEAKAHINAQRPRASTRTRRKKLLAMVKDGHSAREIATALNVSVPTVYNDLKRWALRSPRGSGRTRPYKRVIAASTARVLNCVIGAGSRGTLCLWANMVS